MVTLISILTLAASASCLEPRDIHAVANSSPDDAVTVFARQIDVYLSTRHPRAGAVFLPSVATMFRTQLEIELTGLDVERWLADKTDEDEGDPVDQPDVHAGERFPRDATHGFPARLLWILPPLPEPLEYRIVGRQLLILDLDLDMVVDVLANAFGAAGSDPGNGIALCQLRRC